MSNDNKWGVGNMAAAKRFATAIVGKQVVDLIDGEHPHSRSSNSHYARFADGRIESFSGHRICTKVELEEFNYLKESGLSGNDVREGGTGKIYFDGVLCYKFFFRQVEEALLTARQKIRSLSEHPSDWGVRERRAKLVSKRIDRDGKKYTITSLITDQGCLILTPLIPEPEADEDYIKVEVDDPKLDWFPKEEEK